LLNGKLVKQRRVSTDTMPALPSFSNSSTLRAPVIDVGDLSDAYHETLVVNIPIEPIPARGAIGKQHARTTNSVAANRDTTTATWKYAAHTAGGDHGDFAATNQ
jgi:hypothetical protein